MARPRVSRLPRWVDDRLGASRWTRFALNKIFPDHWSFMIGEIAFYSFIVLLLTGVYLTFFFDASTREVVYDGSYAPLRGVRMTEAYRSVLDISFEVRAGMVMRQMHHWAANVFVAAIVVHVMRVFFTGGFRRPREINWIVGVTLLLLAIANGFAGYSLPDDLLSGTGLRIAYSIPLAVPVVGTWMSYLVFGGEFPSGDIISRLYVVHILLLPAAILALLTVHLALVWHQKHTDFPGKGRSEETITGSPLWPTYMAKSIALFLFVVAVLAALGGLAQINPVWLYGPYRTFAVSSGSQPDWYMGWLDGALRVFPDWEIHAFGHTLGNLFFPGILLPGLTFGGLYAWPFLEAWVTKDRDPHNLLDRPRDRPLRTAIGVAVFTFYAVLFLAGATDVLASTFKLSFEAVLRAFRVLLFVLPTVFGYVTYRLCRGLARGNVRPMREPVAGVIVRTADGGYHVEELHDTHWPHGDGDGDGEHDGAGSDRVPVTGPPSQPAE